MRWIRGCCGGTIHRPVVRGRRGAHAMSMKQAAEMVNPVGNTRYCLTPLSGGIWLKRKGAVADPRALAFRYRLSDWSRRR